VGFVIGPEIRGVTVSPCHRAQQNNLGSSQLEVNILVVYRSFYILFIFVMCLVRLVHVPMYGCLG